MTDPYVSTSSMMYNLHSRLKTGVAEPNELRGLAQVEILPYLAVKYSGTLVLGALYKSATPEERQAFFATFTGYVEMMLARALASWNLRLRYAVQTEAFADSASMLSVRVTFADLVDFDNTHPAHGLDGQWRKNATTGAWQMFDIIINGVSFLLSAQRDFAATLREQGIKGLTQQLEADVAEFARRA